MICNMQHLKEGGVMIVCHNFLQMYNVSPDEEV